MEPVVTLHAGDNRVSLASMPENSIDAVVTDPPYSLTSITKRFGKPGSAPARGGDGSFGRVSGGFMGKAWDASGIERDPEFWAAVYRVMKPGAFVFAFSGARTGHWQACAMEQAGFIMHPMHAWIYGSGFPKGHDASKAIDKHLGAEHLRTVTGVRYEAKRFAPGATVLKEGGYRKREAEDGNEQTFAATDQIGGSPEARAWDGWKYGTQTQKPAMEPIYLGQKPYDGKPVESILEWGVGAFNIDGCRVPTDAGEIVTDTGERADSTCHEGYLRPNASMFNTGKAVVRGGPSNAAGRYPANVLHDGSDAVVALFPETGVSSGGKGKASGQIDNDAVYGKFSGNNPGESAGGFGDSGSAARFFNSFPADEMPWPLAFYHAKAGKADRAGSKHPTVKPIGLLRHLIRHICPPGGTVLDPFGGTGTTAEAARLEGMSCVLMEMEPEYIAFLQRRFPAPTVSDLADDTEDIFA